MFHPVPPTNGCHYVNDNSQGQDYGDDLTEPPFVIAKLDD
jgi:hypothetical protein